MTILFYLLPLLLVQQPNRPEFGTLSGQLRGSDGRPAAGIRVFVTPVEAAIAPRGGRAVTVRAPDPIARSGRGGGTAILSSISQTDNQGRYQLADVLPGRYYIAAGSLASPTYYPSGTALNQGRIVNVVAGETITNLDITLAASAPSNPPRDLWGRLAFEDGTELQVGTLQQFAFILTSGRVQQIAQPFTVQQGLFAFQSIEPGEYVVSVAPLRLGTYLKSITFGNVDLTRNPLTFGADAGDTQIQVFLTKTRPAGTPAGIRIKGRIIGWKSGGPSLELNAVSTAVVNRGHSEDLFSVASVTPQEDGSFEIEGVPPGRYVISRYENDRSMDFDVAGNDVSNLELELGRDNRSTGVALNRNAIRSIRGTVEVEGGVIPEFIVTIATIRAGAAATQTVAVSSREFSVQLPEGEYRISISGLPRGYSVETVTAGPLDLTEPFLVSKSGIADRFTGSPILVRSAAPATAVGAGITVRLRAPSSQK